MSSTIWTLTVTPRVGKPVTRDFIGDEAEARARMALGALEALADTLKDPFGRPKIELKSKP